MAIHAAAGDSNRCPPSPCYRKTMTSSDLRTIRLQNSPESLTVIDSLQHLSIAFAKYLKPSGHGSIWNITGPPSSVGKNIFFFCLLRSS
ncbi:uncharacterized protein DS421_2g46380 [Arachis hypogaea]|nr:uncharacterized protein DS421_2g46380 [Arachis hypogaea]